ncbi:MAG: hypothetical protein KBA46_04000 [Candidatus Omnitrophica bacterium]|nr:hypothetical protein [Candidatus Omnitrophota bacterium]
MKKPIIYLIFIGLLVTFGMAGAQETNTIVSFYPSPAGYYQQVDVSHEATLFNLLLLDDASLYRGALDGRPLLFQDLRNADSEPILSDQGMNVEGLRRLLPGQLREPNESVAFADNYFSPILRARELKATNIDAMYWRKKRGTAGGITLPFTLNIDTADMFSIAPDIGGTARVDCGDDAVLNNVFMLMQATQNKLCIMIEGIDLCIYMGKTKPFVYYTCLKHRE